VELDDVGMAEAR
jgi:hypothetical protein